ncbi:helix-turn-helix domain-containing protein [Prosthecobacter sp.]|uniref:winged helix-turn-helix transcriptional regulator n=1 Tax=Prosthecobacter sp. TaxID=1965333 RepID=UPI002489CCDD|nr:helix-turn-helix domain-containing protein [Prosthecobacter sp.]MDI1312059.1 helix-turn-helix domain-containing protein [Prosthecobacter sp.]
MAGTHKKVSVTLKKKPIAWTPVTAAEGVEQALRMLEGRWKFLILFQLFGGKIRRFSELERAIPAVTQKMLAQQLRLLEKDGIVHRAVYPVIPPKVEYSLPPWGQSLCPVLGAILKWAAAREDFQQK